MNRIISLILFSSICSLNSIAQDDSTFIKTIYNIALSEGKAHEDLRSLCKDIGSRLTGSAEAMMAIEWGKLKMENYGFDTVYLQEIKVPHWERGTKEVGWIKYNTGQLIKTNMLALGGSIGTMGVLSGDLIEFKSIEELKSSSRDLVQGKIVFLNQPMDLSLIHI